MSTQNIVPRINGSGSLGTYTKQWGNVYAESGSLAYIVASGSINGDFTGGVSATSITATSIVSDNVSLTGSFSGSFIGTGAQLQNIISDVVQPTLIDFNTGSADPSPLEGRVFYDMDDHSLSYYDNQLTKINLRGKISNQIIVRTIDDLRPATASMIPLDDSTVYIIEGEVDLGNSALSVGNNTTIRAFSPAINYIHSTTTGSILNANDVSFRLLEVGFSAPSGSLFNVSGSGDEVILMFNGRTYSGTSLGTIDTVDLFESITTLFVAYPSGLIITGSHVLTKFIDTTFLDTNGVTSLDISGATFSNNFKINDSEFTIVSGGIGLAVAENNANFESVSGSGEINGTSFNLATGASATSGYSPLNRYWSVGQTNNGITPSDRFLPTGWGYYQHSGSTQVIGTTPTSMSINTLGSSTEVGYLPRSIRGTDQFWVSGSDYINPISVGDAYTLRLDIPISAKAASPTELRVRLDIGGSATPSITVVDRTESLGKTPPFTVSLSFNIFTLSTFLANGGRILLNTDTGTATINQPGILISRTSSGVISPSLT